MDTLTLRSTIETVLTQYRDYLGNDPETNLDLIFDIRRDRYLLIEHGWQGEHRIYGTLLHLAIADQNIWIHQDGTETGIAPELLQLGVPSDRIVLGYKSPARREIAQLV